MGIKEHIKNIETYFKEMQVVTIDGKQVIYIVVTFPNGWIIEEDIEEKYNVTVSNGQYNGEYYFCGEMENGEDNIFNAIEYNISKMKAAIERAKLLNDKIIELKNIFSDETISLEELRNMEISYKKNHLVYDDPSSLTANAQPLITKIETNEKQEVKFDAIDPKIEKNKKLKDNKNE